MTATMILNSALILLLGNILYLGPFVSSWESPLYGISRLRVCMRGEDLATNTAKVGPFMARTAEIAIVTNC